MYQLFNLLILSILFSLNKCNFILTFFLNIIIIIKDEFLVFYWPSVKFNFITLYL